MALYHTAIPPEELARLVEPQTLGLPRSPKVSRILVEEYGDWAGEEVLQVFVLLDDSTPAEGLSFARLRPIRLKVQQAVRATGETRFPLIRAMTEAAYAERLAYRATGGASEGEGNDGEGHDGEAVAAPDAAPLP